MNEKDFLRKNTQSEEPDLIRIGLSRSVFRDGYHTLMKISWLQFFILFVFGYFCLNSVFAFLYYIGGGGILNANANSYWDAWVFSFQTSTTLGYGYFVPKTAYAHIVVIFDLLSGLLFVAMMTGLAVARFSRPTSRVLFTNDMIITEYDGEKTLMFRLANARSSHIVDVSINVAVVMPERTKEGLEMRRVHDLKLVRSRSPLFSLTWTVMHKFENDSPLQGLTLQEMKDLDITFVVSFTGIEDVFSQTVHGRKFYYASNLVEAKKFEDILDFSPGGGRTIDYRKFHNIVKE